MMDMRDECTPQGLSSWSRIWIPGLHVFRNTLYRVVRDYG